MIKYGGEEYAKQALVIDIKNTCKKFIESRPYAQFRDKIIEAIGEFGYASYSDLKEKLDSNMIVLNKILYELCKTNDYFVLYQFIINKAWFADQTDLYMVLENLLNLTEKISDIEVAYLHAQHHLAVVASKKLLNKYLIDEKINQLYQNVNYHTKFFVNDRKLYDHLKKFTNDPKLIFKSISDETESSNATLAKAETASDSSNSSNQMITTTDDQSEEEDNSE